MGCYGIGMARIAAAAVEQFADEHGISWPARDRAVPGAPGRARASRAAPSASSPRRVYETLRDGGVDVLYDDRDAGAGEKFADAELLGVPLRLTVGRRTLESGEIEVAAPPRHARRWPGIAAGRACSRGWRSCAATLA